MNISLDYDNTYTRDPDFWNAYIDLAKTRGHTVYCVTMRNVAEGDEVRAQLQDRVELILFTARQNKHDYCFNHNVSIDVWIDDMPFFIHNDAQS